MRHATKLHGQDCGAFGIAFRVAIDDDASSANYFRVSTTKMQFGEKSAKPSDSSGLRPTLGLKHNVRRIIRCAQSAPTHESTGMRQPMTTLDPDRNFEGLTPRQWRFVQEVFAGASNVEAYRRTYDCEGQAQSTINGNAATVAHHPLVVAKLKAMRLEVEAKVTLAPLVTREFVIQGITNLALHADKDSTKLRAFELLGKTVGVDLFRDVVVKETAERSVADIERELRDKLASLRTVIDGTATPAPGSPAPAASRQRKPRA